MISKAEKERIRRIIDVLSQAAEGRYEARLDFASEEDPLGSLASAVNTLLEKSDQRISPVDQRVDDQAIDTRRYWNILNSLEETYFETDLTGRLLFFNGRALKDLGYTREELDGLHFHNLVDEPNARKVYEAFHEVFLTGRPNKAFEWRIFKKNKEIIEVESSVALLRDDKDKPVGFRGVVRDITARKQAERDLREHEKKYREILEAMEDTYLETDLRGNFVFFNDSLCRVLGYSREQLQGINYRLITPPDRVQEVYRAFNEVYTTGRQKTFMENRLVAGDGSYVYLEFSMSLLRSPEGEPIGFSGFGRDVTERVTARRKLKESERKLRLMAENVSDIIWTMDYNFRFTYLSPSVYTLTGFTPEEVMEIPLELMVSPEDYDQMQQSLAEALDRDKKGEPPDGEQTTVFEMPFLRSDGNVLWGEVNVNFNRDETGKPFEIVGVTRDITDRKKADEQLRESEERYRMIAERMTDIIWMADMDLRTTYVTPSVQKILGFTPEERMQQTVDQQFTPDSLAYGMDALARELALEEEADADSERTATLTLEYYRKDGSTCWLETAISGIRDEKGALTGLCGVSRDITDRKKAEEALRESEQRYRVSVENVNDVVWTFGLDLGFRYTSPASRRITGYTAEEIRAIGLHDLLSPESFELAGRTLSEELGLESGGQPFDPHRSRTLELEVRRKDGDHIWMEVNATFNRNADGKPTEILVVGRDITERRRMGMQLAESEERYRMIVENMHDSISLLDLDFNLIYQSPSEINVSGYTPEEIMAIPMQDLMTPESYHLAEKLLAEELELEFGDNSADPRRSRTMELEIYHKDGGTIWQETTATFHRDEEGEPIGILLTARDVTDRRRAEEELRESEEKYRLLASYHQRLNDVSIAFSETSGTDDLFNTISESLRLLTGAIAATFSLYDRDGQSLKLSSLSVDPVSGDTVHSFFGPEIFAMSMPVSSAAMEEMITQGIGRPQDLRELSFGTIPQEVSDTVMEAFGCRHLIALAVNYSGEVLGTCVAYLPGDQPVVPDDALKTFAYFSGIEIKRRRAEEELRKSEEKYRTILESIGEGYWETDLEGKFTFFNDAMCTISGQPREELTGLEAYRDATPETQERMFQVFLEVYRTGVPIVLENCEMIRGDGTTGFYEMSAHLLRDDLGNPVGFRGITRDTTERKRAEQELRESEAKYRTILESIVDGYWETDLRGTFTFFNDNLCRMVGHSREELFEMGRFKPASPEMLKQTDTIFNQVYRTGEPKNVVDYQFVSGSGIVTTHELSVALRGDAEGNPIGFRGISRDVTERREMEKALAESEQRYRMIVENMGEILWVITADLRFTYVSPSSTWLTGYTPEETRETPLEQLLTTESYDMATRRLADELALKASAKPFDPKRSVTLEVEAVHKNGHTFWLEITGTFNRNEEGSITEILVVGKNITGRKMVEMELQESERRYRIVAEKMTDLVWIANLDLSIRYVTPSIEMVLGFTPEERMGMSIDQQLTPDSLAYGLDVLAEELALEERDDADPDRSRTLLLEYYHKNGSTRWMETIMSGIRDGQGGLTGIHGVSRDVTDRKKAEEALKDSEQRYRMIVENMRDVIMVINLDLTEQYRSPSAAHLTGYTLEELADIPLEEQVTPESYALMEQVLGEELEREFGPDPVDPQRSRTLEVELYHKDGGTVWIEETATFLRDDAGKPEAILLAIRDITERKRADEEKNKLESQLIQAQKMETVGRLAGGVAHDFNNMLSVILGYVDLAKLRLVKEHPVLKDINEIEKAAVRSRDITAQLLAFSRKQIITPTILNLNDLVVNTEKALSRLIGEDIQLKVRLEKSPWMIKFDPSQIEQILINLAVNARDAMPKGGKLTIETGNITIDEIYCRDHLDFTPGHYVQLCVSDNGFGMDRETIQHIFEPFFTTKAVGKGTGLGMATVYGIIKQNNGLINVYSEPGYGTTFKIYLPRTTEERDVREEDDEKPITAEGGTVLLVEDDPMVLEITRGMLESIGYRVIAADTPHDAVTICRDDDTPLSLVITDVVMPAMSGKELIEKLKEIRPGIKVLFMSGYTADAIAHHGVLEEGVRFLQKPFGLKDLARKVREAVAAD